MVARNALRIQHSIAHTHTFIHMHHCQHHFLCIFLTAIYINKANTEGTVRLSSDEIRLQELHIEYTLTIPFFYSHVGGEQRNFQSKMKGNGCKMKGNECNMKRYEWKLKGNEWKMKGNKCKMQGNECKNERNKWKKEMNKI